MNIEEMKPKNWGKDSLSKFIEDARHNTIATVVSFKEEYSLLDDIHRAFEKLVNHLDNTPECFSSFFVLRAHASYLGALRLSISGQVTEAYMVLRGCLENALYGLYLSKNPQSREIWLNRHNDDESKRCVRKEFQNKNLFDCLESANDNTYRTAKGLYERTIDHGAHPNERALRQLLTKTETEESIQYHLSYLSEYNAAFRACLLTNAQIGVCSLDIFREVFTERFDILGISDDLGELRERAIFDIK